MQAQFDRRLISQAWPTSSRTRRRPSMLSPPEQLGKGRIDVIAVRDNDDIVINVIDDGSGLPKVSRVGCWNLRNDA